MLNNIFEELKSRLLMPDVARFYGLEINRAGFAACPFHPDKTPSLKIYEEHYHCFGCGAHGDVTDFVAKLFHISQYDAAVKLNDDFGLHLTNQKAAPMQQAVSPEVAYRNWLHSTERILNEYLNMLCRWQREYAPKTPDEVQHPHFVESLTNMEQYRFLYEQIRFGTEAEKKWLYLTEHETLKKLAEHIREIQKHAKKVDAAPLKAQIEKIYAKKQSAVDLMLEGIISKEDLKRQNEQYDAEIRELTMQIENGKNMRNTHNRQLDAIREYIAQIKATEDMDIDSTEVYGEVVREMVVYDDCRLDVYLHCVPFGFRLHYIKGKKQ